jgi:Flp pilus assembly pilin Flp
MKLFKNLRNQSGQGLTDYIIIVVLIAVAAITGFTYFGKTVRNQAAAMAEEFVNQDGSVEIAGDRIAAAGTKNDAAENKSLKGYAHSVFKVNK